MNAPAGDLQKVRSSMMNAVHDMPLLVAHDEGFFRDEGLDVSIPRTPGSGPVCIRSSKRAVETNGRSGHRPAKIVALGSAMLRARSSLTRRPGFMSQGQLK